MGPVSLDGKVAVVSGSSKRIGRELAIGLARSGARVVVNYKMTVSVRQRPVA